MKIYQIDLPTFQKTLDEIVEEFRGRNKRFPSSQIWYQEAIGALGGAILLLRNVPGYDFNGEFEQAHNAAFAAVQAIWREQADERPKTTIIHFRARPWRHRKERLTE